jgi:hypothetical protein
MPERANSFPRMIPGVVFVLLAMFAVNVESPVRADSACIEQPDQLAAGTHWVLHYDRAKGRGCWILVDTFGRETGVWGGPVTMLQAQPSAAPAPAVSSQHESMPGNFNSMGASANVTPERSAPQISHPKPPHKPKGRVANANKADNGVRADQKSNGKGHAVKRFSPVLIDPKESALFEEFLQWSELQQLTGAMKPEHAVKRFSPVLIDPEESAQFDEFLRWRKRQQLTGAMKPGPSSQ